MRKSEERSGRRSVATTAYYILHSTITDNLLLARRFDHRRLYLKGGEGVGKQGNMSEVEVENVDEENHPGFKDLEYKEVLLFPGDSMYIAPGDWHYVRSLTTSFSVSYWF